METKKRCSLCGVVKSLDHFHIDMVHKDGYRSECKKCRKRQRIWKLATQNVVIEEDAPKIKIVWAEKIRRLFVDLFFTRNND